MPEQTSADFERVMAQCSRGCFTGLLRVRTREGNGEVRFLSGIQDGIRFDSMEGDAALERLQSASDHEFEAISSLPPINAGSDEAVPPEGRLERFHAAQLMRYCESNSLTCALELEVEGRVLTARYRLGELLSVEPDSEHTSRLAEAKVGLYRFRLPRFELPANVQQRRSVPAAPATASPSKPAPVSAPKPAPAALAETPLVGVRAVAIGGVPVGSTKAPAAAAKSPPAPGYSEAARPAASPRAASASAGAAPGAASPGGGSPSTAPPHTAPVSRPAPSASRPAPAPMRPAASTSERPAPRRDEAPRQAPKVASGAARGADARPGALAETPVMPLVQTKAPAARPAAAVSPAPVTRVPRSPVPPAPTAGAPAARAAASEPPASAGSVSAPPKSAPLEGLWAEAVKPPPQSAPLDLEAGLRPAGGKPPGRAEGLSSLVYEKSESAASSRRQSSSLVYWLVAFALLFALAVAGWFLFGR